MVSKTRFGGFFYCLQKGALPTAFEQVVSSTFSASAVTFIDSALKILIVI
jgi:hypothetical protein